MALCREESDAFVFDWRLENASHFELYKSDFCAQSPTFVVHALDETEWYCQLNDDNEIILCREDEDDDPEEIEVNWKASVLKTDGSVVTTGVRRCSFERDSFDQVQFDQDISDFEDQHGILRLRICLWGQRLQTLELPKDADAPICRLSSDDSDRAADGIPSETFVAVHPRYCCGVTAKKLERVIVSLDSSSLDVLRSKSEVTTFVTFASEMMPSFNIRCSMVESSEFLKIEIRRIIKVAFLMHCDVSLVKAESEVITRTRERLDFNEKIDTLTCEDIVKKIDLTSTQCEASPMSLQFVLTLCSDDLDSWMEKITYNLKPPKMEKIRASGESVLKQKMISLYSDRKYSDVTLRMADGTLEAHKTVLEAWSEVFEKTLNSDMKEKASKVIEIKDVSKATMEAFLRYLYSEEVDEEGLDWERASQLYFAADKYQVISLRKFCSRFLEERLTIQNVCEVMILADQHRDQELKGSAIDYICAQKGIFFKSEDWREFSKANLEASNDIMTTVLFKLF